MNKYLIYTGQGWTEDPNGERVENCQILGRAEGENEDDALDSFLKNNPWVEESGFDEFDLAQLHDTEWV